MKTIVDIVPAPPGWFARWRFAEDITRSYPVAAWAMGEDDDTGRHQVVGVDAGDQPLHGERRLRGVAPRFIGGNSRTSWLL